MSTNAVAVVSGDSMSLEQELYSIREIIGGLRADVTNIRQGVNDNRELMAVEVASIKKDLAEIKENRAAVKGGWFALTGIVAAAGSVGAGVTWALKTLSTTPPTP